MLSSTCLVCFSTVTSGILPVRRSIGVKPETNTKLPARITGLSGMPSFLRCTLTPGTSMTSFLIFRIAFLLILVEHLLKGLRLPRHGEREHEKDARLLRHEVVADDEALRLHPWGGNHAPIPRARRQHHRDARLY